MNTGTLILRLTGPMMSAGTQGRFRIRETEQEPSKSMVVGLVCAAMGKPRIEVEQDGFPTIRQISDLQMIVLVIKEGHPLIDFHTAENILSSSHDRKSKTLNVSKHPATSYRHYLTDVDFLVALQGDYALLEKIKAAFFDPVWILALGRRCCPLSAPVNLKNNLRNGDDAITIVKDVALENGIIRGKNRLFRIVMEDRSGDELRRDVPVDFDKRIFVTRRVKTIFSEIGQEHKDVFDKIDN